MDDFVRPMSTTLGASRRVAGDETEERDVDYDERDVVRGMDRMLVQQQQGQLAIPLENLLISDDDDDDGDNDDGDYNVQPKHNQQELVEELEDEDPYERRRQSLRRSSLQQFDTNWWNEIHNNNDSEHALDTIVFLQDDSVSEETNAQSSPPPATTARQTSYNNVADDLSMARRLAMELDAILPPEGCGEEQDTIANDTQQEEEIRCDMHPQPAQHDERRQLQQRRRSSRRRSSLQQYDMDWWNQFHNDQDDGMEKVTGTVRAPGEEKAEEAGHDDQVVVTNTSQPIELHHGLEEHHDQQQQELQRRSSRRRSSLLQHDMDWWNEMHSVAADGADTVASIVHAEVTDQDQNVVDNQVQRIEVSHDSEQEHQRQQVQRRRSSRRRSSLQQYDMEWWNEIHNQEDGTDTVPDVYASAENVEEEEPSGNPPPTTTTTTKPTTPGVDHNTKEEKQVEMDDASLIMAKQLAMQWEPTLPPDKEDSGQQQHGLNTENDHQDFAEEQDDDDDEEEQRHQQQFERRQSRRRSGLRYGTTWWNSTHDLGATDTTTSIALVQDRLAGDDTTPPAPASAPASAPLPTTTTTTTTTTRIQPQREDVVANNHDDDLDFTWAKQRASYLGPILPSSEQGSSSLHLTISDDENDNLVNNTNEMDNEERQRRVRIDNTNEQKKRDKKTKFQYTEITKSVKSKSKDGSKKGDYCGTGELMSMTSTTTTTSSNTRSSTDTSVAAEASDALQRQSLVVQTTQPGAVAVTGIGGPSTRRTSTRATQPPSSVFLDEHLVEATEVTEGDDSYVPARAYDPNSNPSIFKNRRYRLYGLLFLVVCVAGLVVVAILSIQTVGTRGEDTTLSVPTIAPTSLREILIQEQLELLLYDGNQDLTAESLHDPTSYLYMAMQWLIFDDPLQMDSQDDELVNRFILAAFYFSTTRYGPWKLCNPPTNGEAEMCFYGMHDGSQLLPYPRWLTGSSHCSWFGIRCNKLNHTAEIHLPDTGLNGKLPAELIYLPTLQVFYLSHNFLTGTLPPQYGLLRHLYQIDIDANELTGPIPSSWCRFSKLVALRLSHNHLTGSIPECLWNQENLASMVIHENEMTGTIPTAIGNLRSLVTLWIGGNFLTGTIPTEIALLSKLVLLNLHRNLAEGTIPTEIGEMTNLRRLLIYHNLNLSGSLPTEMAQLTNLRQLELQGNTLTGDVPAAIWGFSNLCILHLHTTDLGGTISTEIGLLSGLWMMHLHNANFRGTIPTEFGLLTRLKQLQLQGNNFTGSIPWELCQQRGEFSLRALVADCLPSELTGDPALDCVQGCCTSCCDADSGECTFSEEELRSERGASRDCLRVLE